MKEAEAYILKQPEPLKSILLHLQILIETSFDDIELKYKWKLPFYYKNGQALCYLNTSKKGYVDVGFWPNEETAIRYKEVLVAKGRKIVKSLRYYTIEDIDETILLDILAELKGNPFKRS